LRFPFERPPIIPDALVKKSDGPDWRPAASDCFFAVLFYAKFVHRTAVHFYFDLAVLPAPDGGGGDEAGAEDEGRGSWHRAVIVGDAGGHVGAGRGGRRRCSGCGRGGGHRGRRRGAGRRRGFGGGCCGCRGGRGGRRRCCGCGGCSGRGAGRWRGRSRHRQGEGLFRVQPRRIRSHSGKGIGSCRRRRPGNHAGLGVQAQPVRPAPGFGPGHQLAALGREGGGIGAAHSPFSQGGVRGDGRPIHRQHKAADGLDAGVRGIGGLEEEDVIPPRRWRAVQNAGGAVQGDPRRQAAREQAPSNGAGPADRHGLLVHRVDLGAGQGRGGGDGQGGVHRQGVALFRPSPVAVGQAHGEGVGPRRGGRAGKLARGLAQGDAVGQGPVGNGPVQGGGAVAAPLQGLAEGRTHLAGGHGAGGDDRSLHGDGEGANSRYRGIIAADRLQEEGGGSLGGGGAVNGPRRIQCQAVGQGAGKHAPGGLVRPPDRQALIVGAAELGTGQGGAGGDAEGGAHRQRIGLFSCIFRRGIRRFDRNPVSPVLGSGT